MTDKESGISEYPPIYSEIVPQKGQNKIISITHRKVNGDRIDWFDLIPDAIQQSRLPFLIAIPVDDRFVGLEGKHLVTTIGQPIQCIVIETEDTSKSALALLKVSLWMTGLLVGTLSYIEQIRNIRILYSLHAAEAGIIVNQNGGDRRSESFKDQKGEHIRVHIARSLDRSESTIRIALDHTRLLNIEAMSELAILKATKRFMAAACKLRTELLSQLSDDMTEAKKSGIISAKFLEWYSYYDPTTGEIIIPSGDTEKQQKEEPTQKDPVIDNIGEVAKDASGDVPPNNSTGYRHGKAVAAQVGQTNTSSLASEAGSPDTDGKQPKDNDTVKEKTDIKDPDETEADHEEEAANNDITIGGKPKLPDVKLGNTPETPVKDVYQQLEEISNRLIVIIKEKPVQHQLSQQVGDVIQALMKLFSGTQNMNGGSLPQITLAGGA
ncbi:MAG: hypothetical protein WCJ37_02290 [Syntrophus sp. (in: bacteria)]